MELLWIKNTDGLQSGIQLINQLERNKFQKLLIHIAENIGQNESGLFTTEELVALQKVLKLDENEVSLVIKTMRHILKRLSRFLMRPQSILDDLSNTLGIEQEKSSMFVEKYKYLIKNLTEQFNIESFGDIEELKQAKWQVNLEMTSSRNQLERHPTVLFELETNKSTNFDKTLIEMDESEIKNFRQQLENIQNEVDNLFSQES